MAQRGGFLLLAAALLLGAARLPGHTAEPSAPADAVYVYDGYAARTDAAFDAASLDRAAYRFQHLHDLYFAGRGIYLAVVPDKALFTVPPEDYTPAGAAETADYLCGALDFLTPVDIAGGLTLDKRAHAVTVNGQSVALAFKEYELLRLLMENRGIAFSREQLLEKIWDYGYDGGSRTVDVHVQTLRAKLGPCGGMIETVRGLGYRFGGK